MNFKEGTAGKRLLKKKTVEIHETTEPGECGRRAKLVIHNMDGKLRMGRLGEANHEGRAGMGLRERKSWEGIMPERDKEKTAGKEERAKMGTKGKGEPEGIAGKYRDIRIHDSGKGTTRKSQRGTR